MKKWYEIIGNGIEMNTGGAWVRGKIVKGYRYQDGIITMKEDDGDRIIWCGVDSGDYRKANDGMTYSEKIHYIADHYGLEPQMRMCQEECAELIQAINKYFRKGEDDEEAMQVAEEMADVIIMCQQLQYLLDCSEVVQEIADEKLNRQIERIENES